MSDQMEATGKQVGAAADSAAAQARDQGEVLRSSIARSKRLTRAKRKARKVQTEAAKRGHEIGEEAAARGKAAARHASKEAQKRGAAAIAGAPAVAAAARKKGEHAIDVARDRGGEALLSALDTEAGKRIASTHAGFALKSKLTARKRRRKKLLLLIMVNAGGAIAFKKLRDRRAGGEPPVVTPPVADLPATETVAPPATGTASGAPIAGVVEDAVAESAQVDAETEPPATTAAADGELKLESDAESS